MRSEHCMLVYLQVCKSLPVAVGETRLLHELRAVEYHVNPQAHPKRGGSIESLISHLMLISHSYRTYKKNGF